MIPSPRQPKELIILTEHFAPSTGATAQLISDLADDLHQKGVSLRVLTSTPGHHHSQYPVLRFSISKGSSVGIAKKIIDGLFFFYGASLWLLANTHRRHSLLIISNPPFIGLIGVLLSAVKHIRYTFLFQDIFPRSASLTGILPSRGPLVSLWRSLLKLVLSRSQVNIVLSRAMAERCLQDFGPDLRLSSIPNWAVLPPHSTPKTDSTLAAEWGLLNTFTVQYSGNLGRLHEIMTILEAARMLQEYPIKFVFVGTGAKSTQLHYYRDTFKLANILTKPFQPRSMLKDSISACDLSIVSLIPGAEDTVSPSKLYGILASSRPVLLISNPDSELASIVQSFQCGVVVSQGDVTGLCQVLLALKDDPQLVSEMGNNARHLYDHHYGRSLSTSKYYQLLSQYKMF